MKRLFLFLLVLLVGLPAAPHASAQSNAISIQGYLTTPDGAPVPDGTYDMSAHLYDSETGGIPRPACLLPSSPRGGSSSAKFEAGDLPNGLYLYRLQAGRFSSTRQMLLIK